MLPAYLLKYYAGNETHRYGHVTVRKVYVMCGLRPLLLSRSNYAGWTVSLHEVITALIT
jgi:hypothetical protein